MVLKFLWPPTAPVPNNSQIISGGSTNGSRFTINEAGHTLTSLGWYRGDLGTTGPDFLRLWRVSDSAALVAIAATDTGQIGWNVTRLASPVALANGAAYIAGGSQLNGAKAWSRNVPVTADAPMTFVQHQFGAYGNAMPTGVVSNFEAGWMAILDEDSPVPGGAIVISGLTTADVNNQLSNWMSLSENTHDGDSAPIANHTLLGTIQSAIDSLTTTATNIKTTVDNIASGATTVVADVSGVLNRIGAIPAPFGSLVAWLNNLNATATTTLNNLSDALASGLSGLSDHIAGLPGGNGGATYVPDPGSWTLVAETDFDTNLAWDTPADVYVVAFDTVSSDLATANVAGVVALFRLAWWSPLAGDYARQRRFIDFPHSHLEDGGRRMPGLLLSASRGATGHVQAWTKPVA
jgi:hypothetical protein